jgi:ribosomal protein L37AE/L43A
MSNSNSENRETSYCPSCKSANSTPRIDILSVPVCTNCGYQYWAFIHRNPRVPSRVSEYAHHCPFCGDSKDSALASGRYRCRKCSRVFVIVAKRRVYRYIHPLSLFYLLPIYLIALPYLLVQIGLRFTYNAHYEAIPAITLLLVWFIFRRAYRVA